MGCGSSNRADVGAITRADMVITNPGNFFSIYEKLESLGQSNYAEVLKVKKKSNGEIRAAKVIKKKLITKDEDVAKMIRTECQTLMRLDSPNIMKLYEVYEDSLKFVMVLEYMEGLSLLDYIESHSQSSISEKFVASVLQQLLRGLNHCESLKISHKDIKPQNLKFSDKENKILKLIDFGVMRTLDIREEKYKSLLGSALYLAPELFKNVPANHKSDIWSCGIVTHILLSGEIPYDIEEAGSMKSLFEEIKNKHFLKESFEKGIWSSVSGGAKDFLMQMLEFDPEKRATASTLLKHPWLESAKSEAANPEDCKSLLMNLSKLNGEQKFQQAVLSYIAYQSGGKSEESNILKMFEKFDKDGNQTLSKAELEEALTEFGVAMTKEEFDKVFSALDMDKSGAINYTEFVAGAYKLNMMITERSLSSAFKFFDKDGCGSIDKAELKKALKREWISEVQLSELFDKVDVNKDDKISFDEFKEMMKKITSSQDFIISQRNDY